MKQALKAYQTTKLQLFKSYPTYQFYAKTASNAVPVDAMFKICILETFHWLRLRMSNLPVLPLEIQTPEPEQYADFAEESIHSFSSAIGFDIHVSYVEQRGIWAFHMSETDMGANWGLPNERPAVRGRSFATDISYVKQADCVEIGVRIICSEPVDTTAPCEVFRPALVKALAANGNIGFAINGLRLDGKPFVVETKSDVERFAEWYQAADFDLPVVLIAESGFAPVVMNTEPSTTAMVSRLVGFHESVAGTATSAAKVTVSPAIVGSAATLPLVQSAKPPASKKKATSTNSLVQELPRQRMPGLDAKHLATSAIGLAVICCVREKCFQQFAHKLKLQLTCGDVWICHRGEVVERTPYAKYSQRMDAFYAELRRDMQTFPKRKAYHFGTVAFHSDVRLMELRERRHAADSLGEQCDILRQENAELKRQNRAFSQQNMDCAMAGEALRVTKKQLREAEHEIEGLQARIEEMAALQQQLELSNAQSLRRITFYQEKLELTAGLPCRSDAVCDWAESLFREQLVITQRAKAEMKKFNGVLDIAALCDGLTYLNAYVKQRRGMLSVEELELYGERYHWAVLLCGKEAVQMRQEAYTVTYHGEKRLLDLHIKYGRSAQNLIRVYFFWDAQTQRVVIGSMPSHLATVAQST